MCENECASHSKEREVIIEVLTICLSMLTALWNGQLYLQEKAYIVLGSLPQSIIKLLNVGHVDYDNKI